MEGAGKIIRRSIHIFLRRYEYFTSTAVLALPFSASILLSQAFFPSLSPPRPSLLLAIHTRLQSLFDAAGFPPSSDVFSFLNLKLSQTISSSILALPFTFTSLLLAKAYAIQFLTHHRPKLPPPFSSISALYIPLFLTNICNSLLVLSANATAFSILFFAYSSLEELGFSPSSFTCVLLSAAGALLYSILIANVLIVCSMAMVSSGMERCGGLFPILKACVVIRGRTPTGLSLALPANLAMAAVEALFQFRVVRPYHLAKRLDYSIAAEGVLISYLYSVLIVIDTIVSCEFFKSCKEACLADQERRHSCYIEIAEPEDRIRSSSFAGLKPWEEDP